ncbi:hypothetical protein K504DRAFT_537381 [Pleomassaria siparia CBS 279.74]|uniref:Uncharacterized protein n=1 Tax=Pleomassaria siparia CBS 279.74 TaxID=1314801 RepID=A0A6G1JYM1_9PLEO|nr:hypothetical protein K504DRAFT_537381 [Pleomassaria siparia CBS 279.74]
MYITSDLFGSDAAHSHSHSHSPTAASTTTWITMPNTHPPALGKRKTRTDDPTEEPSSNAHASFNRLSPSTGRSQFKRQALGHTVSDNNTWTTLYTQIPPHTYLAPERPQKQYRRALPKKVAIAARSTSHLMDVEAETVISSSSCSSHSYPHSHSHSRPHSHPSGALDLRACHVCHTAPRRRNELENYHECKRCKENTCFICARQCANGCGEKICSKCCVEIGQEGDTLCLDCYVGNVNS